MRRFWLFVALALFAPVGTAHAATLVTPRITSAAGDSAFCSIVNAGSRSITATVDMLSFDGSIIGSAVIALDAGESSSITAGGFRTFHCRFSGSFSKTSVRCAASISSGGHSIVAVPAQ